LESGLTCHVDSLTVWLSDSSAWLCSANGYACACARGNRQKALT